MKKIILLLSLFFCVNLFAQEHKSNQGALEFFKKNNIVLKEVPDSIEVDPYSFFPLQVGNFWQYQQHGGFIRNDKIAKDSLLQNGSRLFYFSKEDIWPFYLVDTNYNVFVDPNNWQRHFYKLDAKLNERWWVFAVYTKDSTLIQGHISEVDTIYSGTYLGKDAVFKVISTYLIYNNNGVIEEFWDHDKVLMSGVGLIYEEKDGVQPDFLIGAIINGDTLGTIVGVEDNISTNYPNQFNLYQNYPNPFNSSTTLEYTVITPDIYRIEIFNSLGEKVKTHLSKYHTKGNYKTSINFREFSSGIYLGKISNNTICKQIKMIYLK